MLLCWNCKLPPEGELTPIKIDDKDPPSIRTICPECRTEYLLQLDLEMMLDMGHASSLF